MSSLRRGLILAALSLIVVAAPAADVAARGGGRGGGGGSRGGGGFSRGGPAARGSFVRNQPVRPVDRRNYNRRGPAADGDFGDRHEQRQDRRDERQDDRQERGDDWQDYVDDDGGYYYEEVYEEYYDEGVVYWELPCQPNVIAMGGVVYYVCGSTWYMRAYSEGEVVYSVVPNPTGH